MAILEASELRDYVFRLFLSAGLKEGDAAIVTDILIDTELDGIGSHGISMVPAHVKKLIFSYSLNASLTMEREGAAYAVLNANNMMGILSAYRAMEITIEKAKSAGIAIVLCNHANTFGAASYYVKMAVKNRLIGTAMCNAPAQMAPLNGMDKLLGTNPIAIGIPGNKEAPFIFDMATSVVAKSKINEAIRKGERKIPTGWAADMDGMATNDPIEAVKGFLLPMAGAKGYGLSMAIDIIAGVLSGAAYSDEVGRFYPVENGCMNVGHAFVVLNPEIIYGEDFFSRIDLYLHKIRSSRGIEQKPVTVPGDINRKAHEDFLKYGVIIDDGVLTEIKSMLNQFEKANERIHNEQI